MHSFTDRQKEIIDVSVKLIAEKGIQQLTIKNISKQLGISEPAIYRHFDSKMDILLAILTLFKTNEQSNIVKNDAIAGSSIKQIESLLFEHFRQFTQNPALAAVVFSEEIFQNDTRLSEKVFSIMSLKLNTISNIIENGQKNHEIRNDITGKQLSLVIIGSLRMIITKWRLSGFSFNLEGEGAELWKSLKKMIERS